MKDREVEKMELDDLWDLHLRIIEVLNRKLENEKRKLQNQLDELGRKFGGAPADLPQRRPYPKVEPKYRNPDNPSETWSGRGKTPRWVTERLAAGRHLDEFRIQ
jgi:DNA-binding protein H-NS